MEYVKEVEMHIVRADQYLKSLLFMLSPLYKRELSKNQDVTVPCL